MVLIKVTFKLQPMHRFWRKDNGEDYRVIKTARDAKSINEAAKNGFRPLVRKVEPSKEIQSKYRVLQNRITGEIEIQGDFRAGRRNDLLWREVIGWTYYYPHSFKSPYAAYLIPKDIRKYEKVFVEDLIEDYIGSKWNQGDTYRLESSLAIWTGSNLKILHDEKDVRSFVG